jgi:DNA-binding beta-propeller fold protein YncE
MNVNRPRIGDISSRINVWGGWGRIGLGLVLVAVSVSCASQGGVMPERESMRKAWPEADPQIRLEAILRLHRDSGGAVRFLEKVAGVESTPFFARPYAAAWDGNDLLVTDISAGRVVRIKSDGAISQSKDDLFPSPVGIASCAGEIFVADSELGAVAALGPKLELLEWILEGLDRPTGIACDGARVFVVETGAHQILEIENRKVLRAIGSRGGAPGEFNFPASVALTSASIWVGDTLNFRVQALDRMERVARASFGLLGDAPGDMPRIKGIAVDRRGQLWISDAVLDQVSIYNPDGRYMMSLGGSGGAPGQFSFPAGIAAHPDGRIAVVDAFNLRVQVFRLIER